jgi:hypothetical protein
VSLTDDHAQDVLQSHPDEVQQAIAIREQRAAMLHTDPLRCLTRVTEYGIERFGPSVPAQRQETLPMLAIRSSSSSRSTHHDVFERISGASFISASQFRPSLRLAADQSGVPSLAALCIGWLKAHIDSLKHVGDVPYSLLKPVLVRCTSEQLMVIERCNPRLLPETDELWRPVGLARIFACHAHVLLASPQGLPAVWRQGCWAATTSMA